MIHCFVGLGQIQEDMIHYFVALGQIQEEMINCFVALGQIQEDMIHCFNGAMSQSVEVKLPQNRNNIGRYTE
jgi:hypothetical protein